MQDINQNPETEKENLEKETPPIEPEPEIADPELSAPPVVEPKKETDKPFEVAEPVKESGFKRFLRTLFGADTRTGRVLRPVLRAAALLVGAFAAGLLVAYYLLYQPMRLQRDSVLTEAQRLNGELGAAQQTISTHQNEISGMQATLDSLQAEVDAGQFRIFYLIAKNDVLRARLALLDDENGPGGPTAMAALNDLEAHLQDLLPYVEKVDPVLADLLGNRLEVVRGELVRDAQQAKVELESFYSNLLELEERLFQ